YMVAVATALRVGSGPADMAPVDAALHAYSEEVAAVRSEGLTRGLPVDAMERFFALGFSLDQMRQNLNDLKRCHGNWCTNEDASGKIVTETPEKSAA
ncbi:FUSC family protein, partial [Bradyrhizobium sp. 10BB]|nr:FUSC family protein [Bradyrhizobium acaciae]